MVEFVEDRFPEKISYGARGGACFSTQIVTSSSGHEQRNINWSKARAKYQISTGLKDEHEKAELIAFFQNRRGRAIGFRFKDWSDFRVEGGYIGSGDGRRREFQLVKYYTSAGQTYIRQITKPVDNNFLKIYVDGRLNRDAGVDFTRGKVIFDSPPAARSQIRADFEFDVPVRFDTDHLDLSTEDAGSSSWSSIPLIEVRV